MNVAFYGMLAIAIFSTLALGVVAILTHSSASISAKTFDQIISPRRLVPSSAVGQQATQKLFQIIQVCRASLRMTDSPALHRQFECAGLTGPAARDIYFAARFCGPVLMAIAASFSPYNRVVCICAGAGIAYMAPAIVLGRLIKKHRTAVRLAIPDAIDLLVICVDAGLGMDQAMVRVGDELVASHPAISQEFGQINREQRAGKMRLDAWREMAARTAVPETEALVNMLMQTERFGTPIARALSSFGDTIRQKRRQKAEEMAAKTTIKIIFPLVLFIFPCIFIVLLGPTAITIYHNMSSK